MRDDFLTADWAYHHRRLTAHIASGIATLLAGFERLNRRQFDAPWRRPPAGKRGLTLG